MPVDWSKYEEKPQAKEANTDDWSQYEVKKKSLPPVSASGAASYGNGLNLSQGFPPLSQQEDVVYSPITNPELRQQLITKDRVIREQRQAERDRINASVNKLYKSLDPETQKNWEVAAQAASIRPTDKLTAPTEEERAHEDFMDSNVGKMLGTVGYIGSKATKGALQTIKGASWLANKAFNGNTSFGVATDISSDQTFNKADELSNLGLTKSDINNIETASPTIFGKQIPLGTITKNLGGLAEILPAAMTGQGASSAFALQGFGQGKDAIDQAEKASGQTINPMVKDAFILGTGAVNGLLMGDLGKGIFGKLPAGLRQDIVANISANAIKEASNKGVLSGEALNKLLQTGAKAFGDKLATMGVNALKTYNKAAVDLSALQGANFALKTGVDATTDKPVFNESAGDLAEGIQNTLTEQAPFFAAAGTVGEAGKLFPNSTYKNTVVESLMKDPSTENANKLKSDLADIARNEGWRTEELEGSLKQVDNIRQVASQLPRTLPENKLVSAVDLVNGRNELQQRLSDLQAERGKMDESVKDIVPTEETLLQDKIDQANDKLRSIASKDKATYSKGTGDEEGKFFKTIGGKKEEITESRYDLENLERDIKAQDNKDISGEKSSEEPTAQEKSDIEETQPTVETSAEGSAANPLEESTQETPIANEPTITNPETEATIQSEPEQQIPAAENSVAPTETPIGERSQIDILPEPNAARPDVISESKPKDEPIGINKAETNKQREMRGLESLPESDKTSLSELFDMGRTAVENGEINTHELEKSIIDKPRNLSKEEVGALLFKRQDLRAESESLSNEIAQKIADGETGEALQPLLERRRFLDQQLAQNEEAVRLGSRENSLSLNALRNLINSDYTLSAQRDRMMAAAGGELTPAMESELVRYDKELKEAQQKLADYEQQINELRARKVVDSEMAIERKAKKQADKTNLKEERKVIVQDFLKQLEKIRKSGTAMSDIPYRRELAAAAPFMKKMVTNLVKEGVVEFKDVIATIHEAFAEHIDGLKDRDVMDVLAGKHNERKATRSELEKQKYAIKRLAKLTGDLEDLRKGEQIEKNERRLVKKREDIAKLEKEVKELEKQFDLSPLEKTKESLRNRIAKINERIQKGDFEKASKEKVNADPEAITLQAKVRKAQNNFDAMADRLSNHRKTKLEKTLSTYNQIRRLMLLSGVKTLGKLYAFALTRSISTPIEEVVNTLNSKTPFLKRIAQRSPRFSGGLSPNAEAKAIATRLSKVTLQDSFNVLKTGVGELDRIYGKNGVDKDFDLNPSALDFFGRLHGALKNSTKRAEFYRSFQKRLEYAAKQGQDINDPNVQFATGLEAYADAKRSILMNDNILVDKGYKSLLRGLEQGGNEESVKNAGKVMAAVIRAAVPIVKIPTNYVLETTDFATGGIRALPKIIGAIQQGAESLSPKDADMVLRTLAKGQIGLAAMIFAYHNPQMFGGYYSGRRDDKDLKAGDIVIDGYKLPHWMSHNPIFEAMQVAATMRRAADTANGNGAPEGLMNQLTTKKRDAITEDAAKKLDKNNPDPQVLEAKDGNTYYNVVFKGGKPVSIIKQGAVKQGLKTAVEGLGGQIPLTGLSDVFNNDKTASNFTGGMVRNQIEPRLLQEAAEFTDKDAKGEPIKRNPQTFTDQLKVGVPGLREQVQEKTPYVNKKVSTIRLSDGTLYNLTPKQIEERQKLNEEYLDKNGERLKKALSKKKLTQKDVQVRLENAANKHSKVIMLKRYKKANGKYNFAEIEE